jgi:redox-sensitive bicupin YhaK (pirin superfamily)
VFHHHASLPVLDFAAGAVTLIAGALMDHTSPAEMFTPIVGAEIAFRARGLLVLPVRRDFEHAALCLAG